MAAPLRGLNIYGFISSLSRLLRHCRFLANEVYFGVASYLRMENAVQLQFIRDDLISNTTSENVYFQSLNESLYVEILSR